VRDPWWPLTDHSGGGGARVAARPSRGEREAHHGRPVGLPTDQCELEEVVGEVNDGGRGDGDRDGGKEEGEGRHQKRAEPEAREEREGGNEQRYARDEGVLDGASYLERGFPRRHRASTRRVLGRGGKRQT